MFRSWDGLNERADGAVIETMQAHIAAIHDGVDEVRSYEPALNTAAGGKGYNCAILSSFDSAAGMERYERHPPHREFVASTDPYTDNFLSLGYTR